MPKLKSKKIAVFDIDGTIFRSSLLIELVSDLISEDVFPANAEKGYEKEFTAWLDRKGSYEDYIYAVVRVYEKHINGVPHKVFMKSVKSVINFHRSRVYRYTRDLIADLRKKGYILIAISLSPSEIVKEFGKRMGFDLMYGRDFEVDKHGKITDKVTNLEFMGDKAKALKHITEKEGLSLKGSIGCGDTESDIKFLSIVTKPICFNPNQNLYRHAKKKGWKVVVERKDMIYTM